MTFSSLLEELDKMSLAERNEACIQGLAACSERLSEIAPELEHARKDWLETAALVFQVSPSKLAPVLSRAFRKLQTHGTFNAPSDEEIRQLLSIGTDRRANNIGRAEVTATITATAERLARLAMDQVVIQNLADELVYRLYDVPLESARAVERYLVSLDEAESS